MKTNRILFYSVISGVFLSAQAFADVTSGTCGDNCTWEVDGTTVKITGSNDKNNPATMQDYSSSQNSSGKWVTTAPWGAGVTSVQFDGYIGNIGAQAFVGSNLTSVSIPDSVTTIGKSAFYGSSSIQSVDFGDNSQLQSIGRSAFYQNTSLQSVNFGENSQLQSIGDGAFWGNKTLDTLTIPASVTTIGRSAFEGSTIGTLIFEEETQLSSIGGWAFDTNVTSVVNLDELLKNFPNYINDNSLYMNQLAINYQRNCDTTCHTATIVSHPEGNIYCKDMEACQDYFAMIASIGGGDAGRSYQPYTYDKEKGYIVDGLYYKTIADLLGGNSYVPKMPKRIYTVEEASEAVKGNKNTFSIKYR